jgi:hypothetical protein
MNKKYDVVVWGASGFTGRLDCEYIFKEYTTKGSDLKWAMAGRDLVKLKQIREKFADNTIPILVADSDDSASLNDLAKRGKLNGLDNLKFLDKRLNKRNYTLFFHQQSKLGREPLHH